MGVLWGLTQRFAAFYDNRAVFAPLHGLSPIVVYAFGSRGQNAHPSRDPNGDIAQLVRARHS